MKHNKQGRLIPWCAYASYPDKYTFMVGTAYTKELQEREARKLLEELLDSILPHGWRIEKVVRGKLVFNCGDEFIPTSGSRKKMQR